MAGVQTVTRKVTNVGDQAETYTASYTGLAGITVALPAVAHDRKGRDEVVHVSRSRQHGAALNATSADSSR